MNRTYLRGDMYYADLGRGIGSEQEGYRPVLIIQNNTGNKYSSTVVVAAISSKVDAKAKLPTHYLLKAENQFYPLFSGLYAHCEWTSSSY